MALHNREHHRGLAHLLYPSFDLELVQGIRVALLHQRHRRNRVLCSALGVVATV